MKKPTRGQLFYGSILLMALMGFILLPLYGITRVFWMYALGVILLLPFMALLLLLIYVNLRYG